MSEHSNDTCVRLCIPKDYPYAYETHLHTSEASACAIATGAEMARACHAAGYTGIFVTNHFIYGNTCVDRSLPWNEWVEQYCKGYENAKAEGDKIGLQVFFGWEAAYMGTEFLIYGLTKEWLLSHPEVRDCTIEEQFRMVHKDGGLIVHCHPYREESYIPEIRLFPEYTDAVEVINATHSSPISTSHNNPEFDENAKRYAIKYDKPMTAGSDIHNVGLIGGATCFQRKLKDDHDYIRAILSKEPVALLNGSETFGDGVPYFPPYVK